ncbi:MAG: insulinase family protein, partial [Armatimonadetes bacterium]|nr:insulinase family protein [Armatimonadota bacterium]
LHKSVISYCITAFCILLTLWCFTSPFEFDREQYNIEHFRLTNGLRCTIVQVPHATTVGISAAVKLGAEHELGVHAPGVRFMLAHALLNGTRLQSGDEFLHSLAEAGIELDCAIEPDCIIFRAECLPQHYDTALQLLSDVLIRPALDSKAVEAVREKALSAQVQVATTPLPAARQSLREMLFRGTQYAHPICGYERTVKRITREHLVDFYDAYFRSRNMAVCVIGDITMKVVKGQLIAAFNSLPKGASPFVEQPKLKPPEEPQHIIRQLYGNLAQLVIVFLAPPIGAQDAASTILLSNIIGGGYGSRLYRLLREEKALAYYARSWYEPSMGFGELFIHIATEREKVELCQQALEEMLSNLRDSAVSEGELEDAKERAALELQLNMGNVKEFSAMLARLEVHGVGASWFWKLQSSINRVTPLDVLNVARRYLKCAAMVVLLPM